MTQSRNIFAAILAVLVLLVTVLTLLGIWEIIDIDYQRLVRKGLWSLFTLFCASAVVMFIYNVIYKAEIKPPKPPGGSNL